MTLRQDRRAETIMPVFVALAIMLVLTAVLIGMMTNLFVYAERGDWDVIEGMRIIDNTTYDLLDPAEGYAVTNANVTDDYMEADNLEFTLGTTPIGARVVRDSMRYSTAWKFSEFDKEVSKYKDSVIFRTDWGWWSYDMDSVPFEEIEADQIAGTNTSASEFVIRGHPCTLLIATGGDAANHSTLLWANLFNLSLARSTDQITNVSVQTGFWTILGQMMTASLPNTIGFMNTLIAAVWWTTVGFMAVVLVTRVFHGE